MDIANILNISAFVLIAAAAFGWANLRWLKLPHTIAMLLLALCLSLMLLSADALLHEDFSTLLKTHLAQIKFSQTLLIGMLSFLLFAGALHTDMTLLRKHKWTVLSMATLGVILSTGIVAVATYYALQAIGMEIPMRWCLVFGALISPTDPVAVLSILKRIHLEKSLEVQIAGESLFNDGIGIVAFTGALAFATSDTEALAYSDISLLLLKEVGAGLLIGFGGGAIAFFAMRAIDEYSVEVPDHPGIGGGGLRGLSCHTRLRAAGGGCGRSHDQQPRTQICHVRTDDALCTDVLDVD